MVGFLYFIGLGFLIVATTLFVKQKSRDCIKLDCQHSHRCNRNKPELKRVP